MPGIGSWVRRPWLVRRLWRDARLAARLLREPQIPLWIKATLPAAAVYVVSPLDLMPDVLPGIGQIDDLAIILGAVRLFLWLCPRTIVGFHDAQLSARRPYEPMTPGDVVIDAEYRRES